MTIIVKKKIECKTRRRSRTPFMEQVMEDIGIKSYTEHKRTKSDKEKWRKILFNPS